MLPDQKLVNGHISVEPLPPLWLLYCKSAERVHRPGSRRLGGVEATGASVATADSWPDRRKGWASPEWGPALRLAVMGGVVPGRGALTWPIVQLRPSGRGLFC